MCCFLMIVPKEQNFAHKQKTAYRKQKVPKEYALDNTPCTTMSTTVTCLPLCSSWRSPVDSFKEMSRDLT